MRLRLLVLIAAVALAPTAVANSLRFEDPQGDQVPFPAYLDLLVVEFNDAEGNLTVTMQLGDSPPGSPSSVYEILFESSTQGHNFGCFLGTSDPSAPEAENCFGYRYPLDQPVAPTTAYSTVRFARDDQNHTLQWIVRVRDLAEPEGEGLHLVRAFAQVGLSQDDSGDVSLGRPQDEASTDDVYVMPAAPDRERTVRPEELEEGTGAEQPRDVKETPGLPIAYVLTALVGSAARTMRAGRE